MDLFSFPGKSWYASIARRPKGIIPTASLDAVLNPITQYAELTDIRFTALFTVSAQTVAVYRKMGITTSAMRNRCLYFDFLILGIVLRIFQVSLEAPLGIDHYAEVLND